MALDNTEEPAACDRLVICPHSGHYDWQIGLCTQFTDFSETRCKGRLDCNECDIEYRKQWEIRKRHGTG